MSRVTHFEIPADNPERAIQFYSGVFGWTFHKWEGPMQYWMIETGKDAPGIDGGLARRESPDSTPTSVIQVDSIDESLKKIEKSGGKIIVPKSPIPGVGHVAYFHDPERNMLGIFQPDPSAK
ncbi:VOC family protein [bacterium]|nr:VOC family protein [bacterium]